MGEQTLVEQLRGVRLIGCTGDRIYEGADDDVCEQCQYIDALADKVEVMVASLHESNESNAKLTDMVVERDEWIEKALPSLRGTRDMCLRYEANAKGVDHNAMRKHGDDARVLAALIAEGQALIGTEEGGDDG